MCEWTNCEKQQLLQQQIYLNNNNNEDYDDDVDNDTRRGNTIEWRLLAGYMFTQARQLEMVEPTMAPMATTRHKTTQHNTQTVQQMTTTGSEKRQNNTMRYAI